MGTVVLDANVVIAFLDPANTQHEVAVALLTRWLSGDHQIVLSASVYAEVLVQPLRVGLEDTIDEFIRSARIRVVPIDRAGARRAAELRVAHPSLRLPDALALTIAMEANTRFLTLDNRLRRVAAEMGIQCPGAEGAG